LQHCTRTRRTRAAFLAARLLAVTATPLLPNLLCVLPLLVTFTTAALRHTHGLAHAHRNRLAANCCANAHRRTRIGFGLPVVPIVLNMNIFADQAASKAASAAKPSAAYGENNQHRSVMKAGESSMAAWRMA